MIFFRPPRFAAVVQILGTAAGLLSIVVFFTVFPLDFSAVGVAWVNTVMKIALIAGHGRGRARPDRPDRPGSPLAGAAWHTRRGSRAGPTSPPGILRP